MHKLKTLFDILAPIEPQKDATTQPESRTTLNEILLLNKIQAATRYNLGAASIQKVASDCGAIVRIGRRVGYHRKIMDEYLKSASKGFIDVIDGSTEQGLRYLKMILGCTREASREWKKDKNEDCITESRQEIIKRIQTVRNPELLTKILTYVKCWTDDEGGAIDER